MSAIRIGRTQRVLVGIVVFGAVVIAGIGFAGSYAAVRDLAIHKGFGWFANVFPIGIDAGIVVLLSLDLLLTWFRIPFPLLRQTAWLLTAATIAFNGAAAWPDPLGVGMHAVIPILFVVSVEAARHAIGRIADITADRHMESVRIARWLLAFPSTFRLWRRMKLWELRSYDEVIRLEQDRLVYQARLTAKYGRAWRRKAPVESLMPLRLARYGVPLAETGPAGLSAAGITVPEAAAPAQAALTAAEAEPVEAAAPVEAVAVPEPPAAIEAVPQPYPQTQQQPQPQPEPVYAPEPEPAPRLTMPDGPIGRGRRITPPPPAPPEPASPDVPDGIDFDEALYAAFNTYATNYGQAPNARQLGLMLEDSFGITNEGGGPLNEQFLRPRLRELLEQKRLEEVS